MTPASAELCSRQATAQNLATKSEAPFAPFVWIVGSILVPHREASLGSLWDACRGDYLLRGTASPDGAPDFDPHVVVDRENLCSQ